MLLESMLGGGNTSIGMAHVKSHIVNLTMKLQDVGKAMVVWENVWCILCHEEGHHRNECPMMGSYMTTGAPDLFLT
jgi:hypothetical protein